MAPLFVYNQAESQTLKDYLLQLRQEIGARLAGKMFTESGPTPVFKLWTMYNRKKFMSLSYAGPE